MPEVEIACSQANLPKFELLTRGFDDHVRRIAEAGYDGVEAHPFGGKATGQLASGRVSEDSRRMLTSAHQGFRTEKSLLDPLRRGDRNPFWAWAAFFVMEERVNSLSTLQKISEMKGAPLPLVLYPSESGVELQRTDPCAERTFQPKEEVMELWKESTAIGLLSHALSLGWSGLCYDTMHSLPVISPEEINGILPHNKASHFSLGRTDENPHKYPTDQWLKSVVDGDKQSLPYELIRRLSEGERLPRFVTEVDLRPLGRVDWTETHAHIVGNLRNWILE